MRIENYTDVVWRFVEKSFAASWLRIEEIRQSVFDIQAGVAVITRQAELPMLRFEC